MLAAGQPEGRVRFSSSIYTLNETAAHAWELVDGKRTLGEILGG